MRRRTGPTPALLLAAALLPGCREEEPIPVDEVVPIAQVPPEIMKVARQRLPGVEFTKAWKGKDRETGKPAFEIRGHLSNGKIREVKISTAGEFLEEE